MSTQDSHEPVEVSFGEVAAEDPAESIEREGDATDAAEVALADETDTGPALPFESDNDTPPDEPTLSTMTGMGPVSGGDDLTA